MSENDVVVRAREALDAAAKPAQWGNFERYNQWLNDGGPRDLLAEVERLTAEVERLTGLKPDPDHPLEIRHGWLVETGYEPDLIPGYGYLPDTDAMPLLLLSDKPGWPDTRQAEADIARLRAQLVESGKADVAAAVAEAAREVEARLRAEGAVARIEMGLDDVEYEHVEACQGKPTCPGCWIDSIRRALKGGA